MPEEEVVNTADSTPAEAIESQAETEAPAERPVDVQKVSDSRLTELNERLKNTEATLNVAMQTIQSLQRPSAATPADEPDYLDPAVKKLSDDLKRQGAATAGLWNELDLLKVRNNPNYKDYSKYEAQVETIINQARSQGQFFTREQVYIGLKGQEALKSGGRQPAAPAEEPGTPEAIPQTRPAAKVGSRPKGPETLDDKIAKYKDVVF